MIWQRFFVGTSLIINVVLLYSLVWGDQGLMAYQALKEQHKLMEARVKELDEKNLAVSREIRLLQSDEKYQEKMIRKRFNYVKDNEILYIFPGAHDTAKTGAASNETKN